MKRLTSSSHSFHALLPISSSVEEKDLLLEEEEEKEEDLGTGINGVVSSRQLGEKKRRLSTDQVKALEKNFEAENKLDPERKARLAQDLGLQPRQVAVWFQNRRARWKTKQLDGDFAALKSRHHALKLDCDTLRRDKDALLAEIRELKAKLSMESEIKAAVTEEEEEETGAAAARPAPLVMCKDGASDSCDSSTAVFNDEPLSSYALMSAGFNSKDHEEKAAGFSYLEAEELLSPEEQDLPWYCSFLRWD